MSQDTAHETKIASGIKAPSHQDVPSDIASNLPSRHHNEKVSAIVVSYYTGPILARAIASLKNQPDISEIIIIDNGNWPGSVNKAVSVKQVIGDTTNTDEENKDGCENGHEDGPEIHIITGHGNVGFSTACNLGATKAQNPYLLFLNPDAIMPSGGVAQMLQDQPTTNETPWMMGAKLIGPNGIEQSGCRRITLTPWRAFVEACKLYHLAPRHPYFRRFNLTHEPCPRDMTPVPVTSGACFLIPADDYALIDGMDENYFLHVEDIDFCLRFRNAGGTVFYNPKIEVTHYKGSSRASKVTIERSKTIGMKRYFNQHFSGIYPPLFLPLVNTLLWIRLCGFVAIDFVKRTLAFLGLRKRRGRHVAIRARAHARAVANRHQEQRPKNR